MQDEKTEKGLKIACIIGTRPEVIKMAPVIHELKKHTHIQHMIINTAQHRQMLDQMCSVFHLRPDIDLNIMEESQTLADLTAKLCAKLSLVIAQKNYDAILVQGDTTTTFVASLVGFYNHIPVGHIESGLRSFNLNEPFPEELNRLLISRLTTWHFAPTKLEEMNLIKEGIPKESIHVTGNTVVDSLLWILKSSRKKHRYPHDRIILVTVHRREHLDEKLIEICHALKRIANEFSSLKIIFPAHLNPAIQKTVNTMLTHHKNIIILSPLKYDEFIQLMEEAYLILTDSGGIQEEAPALSKPVLILRNNTERIASLKAGVSKLVKLDSESIFNATAKLLTSKRAYKKMARTISPYGKGDAAKKIVSIILNDLYKD